MMNSGQLREEPGVAYHLTAKTTIQHKLILVFMEKALKDSLNQQDSKYGLSPLWAGRLRSSTQGGTMQVFELMSKRSYSGLSSRHFIALAETPDPKIFPIHRNHEKFAPHL